MRQLRSPQGGEAGDTPAPMDNVPGALEEGAGGGGDELYFLHRLLVLLCHRQVMLQIFGS